MWYLVALIWLALIAGVIWLYQKRRQRFADAAAQRMEAVLADLKRAALALEAGHAPAVASAAPLCAKRERLLAPAQALLYLVFKTGLPGHEIFPNLTLTELVELVPARPAEQAALAKRAAQYGFDLVVCTRQFAVVAVVVIESAAAAQDEQARFAARCLEAAGIRRVVVDPARLPKHQEVHALVYGYQDAR